MGAPVKNTCPDIDKYIRSIKSVIVRDRDLINLNEQDILDTAIAMNDELKCCIDYLEEMRSSNGALRDWGEGLEIELEDAAISINEFQNTINDSL